MSLLENLIILSEKAAEIARICRQDQHLFELLVQEKTSDEANTRFVQDFKTLADVLVQETIKHELGMKFPELKDHILGEENNTFSNKLGETITVDIKNSSDETVQMLQKILNGDLKAAETLAFTIHKEINLIEVNTEKLPEESHNFDCINLGVWIDPIDSTAEYINGNEIQGKNGIFLAGLRCVTVLLGVFDRFSGVPLIGVVNQPFYEQINTRWKGKCYWGTNTPDPLTSLATSVPETKVICLSASENTMIKDKFISKGFLVEEAAGAGYKLLCVALGLADCYLLTKNTTFRWDTCGPHGLLSCLGGGIVILKNSLEGQWKELNYGEFGTGDKMSECRNEGGIVAFRNKEIAKIVIELLKT